MRMVILSTCESKSEVVQSCPTLCDPMDCSLPGSSLHGIFQARILEWVAISLSRRSSQPRDWTQVSCIVGKHFTICSVRLGYLRFFLFLEVRLYCCKLLSYNWFCSILYTKISSKWIKDLNVRPDTIKHIEENISRTISNINRSNIFFNLSAILMEIKPKIFKKGPT